MTSAIQTLQHHPSLKEVDIDAQDMSDSSHIVQGLIHDKKKVSAFVKSNLEGMVINCQTICLHSFVNIYM